jgi:hypothetical protein
MRCEREPFSLPFRHSISYMLGITHELRHSQTGALIEGEAGSMHVVHFAVKPVTL